MESIHTIFMLYKASVTVNGRVYSASKPYSKKGDAEQAAAAAALEHLLGEMKSSSSSASPLGSVNYKQKLQEYCQKMKKDLPSYTAKSTGPPHNLRWQATGSCPWYICFVLNSILFCGVYFE
jgi:dsRNA-specific ribonuclease